MNSKNPDNNVNKQSKLPKLPKLPKLQYERVDTVRKDTSLKLPNETKQHQRARLTASSLVLKIEPIPVTVDKFGELLLRLGRLLDYSVARIRTFPKDQKWQGGLGSTIMTILMQSLELCHQIAIYNPSYDRESGLRTMAVKMRTLRSLVLCANNMRYINGDQLEAWARRSKDVDDLAVGLAMSLQKKK